MNRAEKSEPVTYTFKENQQAWWKRINVHKPGVDVLSMTCLAMLLVHLFIVLSGGVSEHQSAYNEWFGLKTESLLRGRVWQLVTYSFLHANWFHLGSNVVMMWLVGGRLIHILNQRKVAICLLLGSVSGGVFFVLFDFVSGQGAFLVGASGATFALFLVMASLSPNAKMIPIPVRAKNMAIGVLTASLILAFAHPGLNLPFFKSIGIWIGQSQWSSVFQIAHACHLGGGLAGLWLAKSILGKMITLEDLSRSRIH